MASRESFDVADLFSHPWDDKLIQCASERVRYAPEWRDRLLDIIEQSPLETDIGFGAYNALRILKAAGCGVSISVKCFVK